MSNDSPAAAHSLNALAQSEDIDMPGPIAEAPASSRDSVVPGELAAAEREIAIETLRDPAASNAMTAEQKAELERRVAAQPTSRDAPEGEIQEMKKEEERKRAFFDELSRIIVTRNLVTEQMKWVHFKRSTEPEFKRLLDDAIAGKENDPVVLVEKELVISWRLDVERQKHERVWALWQAENMEKARRAAAMRARAQERSIITVD